MKKITHDDKVGFSPGMQRWLKMHKSVIHHINRMKGSNCMIISIDAKKAFSEIQHPFMVKTPSKLGVEGTYLNTVKAVYENPLANIILEWRKAESIAFKFWSQTHLLTLIALNKYSTGSLSQRN